MSDDERPSMEDVPDVPSDEDEDAMEYGADKLPEGVQKEIITESTADSWKSPKKGDEVTVHYVGTLESDGSEFDSSRGRGEPFTFTLGRGQVIKGWDVGVKTMKKGEVAKFTLAPEFAYGDSGSPPKIPEKATLVFEIELISWMSKDDLFGDEGVIKVQLEEGSGWKTPKDGDELLISVKAVAKDGTCVEDRPSFAYVVGSETLGPLARACDKALMGMKNGEKVDLVCSKEYACGDKTPDGATITLALEQICDIKDVSMNKDKSMMKKLLAEGEGYDTPKEASSVKLVVSAATDGSASLPGFTAKTLEFALGNGEVCDALECVASEMKKGEKAMLTCTGAAVAAAQETQLGLKVIKAEKIVLSLEMSDFEKGKDTWNMSEEEKLEFGAKRKEMGSSLLKNGRLEMALQRYKKVTDLFGYIDNMKEESKEQAKQLKQACELNKAMVHLKLQEFTEAKTACNAVLKDDARNLKATYRRAQADLGLKNFADCTRDCKKVIEIDPQNKDARNLLKQAQLGQKEEDKNAKGLFANMCKALGKGPIPEPYKAKDNVGDDDMEGDYDDDEEDLPDPDDCGPQGKMDVDTPAKDATVEASTN